MTLTVPVDAALWGRAVRLMLDRARDLVRTGDLRPPVLCELRESDGDESLLDAFVLDSEGNLSWTADAIDRAVLVYGMGLLERADKRRRGEDARVFLPLRMVFDDGEILYRCLFEIPPETVQ